jgi:predicted metalloprotease with PDZ domain
MYLKKENDWFEVLDVVAGGPADEAGIKIGDRILSLDGINASRLTSGAAIKVKRTSRVSSYPGRYEAGANTPGYTGLARPCLD